MSVSYDLLPVAWFGCEKLAELKLLCRVVLEASERESKADYRTEEEMGRSGMRIS